MNRWLLILLLLPFWAVAQVKPLKVELIDFSVDKVPFYCGYQTEWGILKFRVKEASKNFQRNEVILALFQCPRETMENGLGLSKYNSGQLYLLILGERTQLDKVPAKPTKMFTESNRDDLPLYWLGKLEAEK